MLNVMRLGIPSLAAIALLSLAQSASANPLNAERASIPGGSAAIWSRSKGYAWRGRMEGSVRLPEDKHVRHVQKYTPRGRHWGTAELVGLIQRSARHVSRAHGPGRMSVGELSARSGGRIDGHKSHQNGRDVDIGFYLTDDRGKVLATPEFVYLRKDGTRSINQGMSLARFDVARNWSLVEALVLDRETPVQYIFAANSIRRLLLQYARSVNASPEIIERASKMIMPPGSGKPHTDHFHVRIYCPKDDKPACREDGQVWSWSVPGGENALSMR
jgi:penicillin-insensitive murein endopeptidase